MDQQKFLWLAAALSVAGLSFSAAGQTIVSRPENRAIVATLQTLIPPDTYTGMSSDNPSRPCVVSVAHNFDFKDSRFRSLGNGTFNVHVSVWYPNDVVDGYVTGPLAKFELFSEGNVLFPPPTVDSLRSKDGQTMIVTTSQHNSIKLPDSPHRYILRQGQIFRTVDDPENPEIDPNTGQRLRGWGQSSLVDESCTLRLRLDRSHIDSVTVTGCGRITGDGTRSMGCAKLMASTSVSAVILPKGHSNENSDSTH